MYSVCTQSVVRKILFISAEPPPPSEHEGVAPLLYQDNLEPPLGGAYHLAVDGKSFGVIREHCPEVMEKVSICLSC